MPKARHRLNGDSPSDSGQHAGRMKHFLPAALVLLSFLAGAAVLWSLASVGVVVLADLDAPDPNEADDEAEHQHAEQQEEDDDHGEYLRLPKLPALLARKTSKIVYLNREGTRLTPGVDDASRNVSSIVKNAGLSQVNVPPFTGSLKTWQRVVKCLQSKFKPFDVVVTDQRPVHTRDYIMATFGGTAQVVGRSRQSARGTGGLAPFNSRSIPRAVVFIFTSTLRNRITTVCETAGMEIAHAYGLDHGYHCKDLMTYKKRCGTRVFVDKTVRCGENKPRDCSNGEKTQNSFQHLLKVLGPRKKAPSAGGHVH